MKPTISTSPLASSCTTAGTSPSSFEKSNVIACPRGRPHGAQKTKTPPDPAGLLSFAWLKADS